MSYDWLASCQYNMAVSSSTCAVLTVFAYAHSGPQGEALKPLETFIFILIL